MISKRLAKYIFLCTLLGVLLIPGLAFGQEAAVKVTTMPDAMKAMAAALAMGISAFAAAYAQARIGSAGQGTLAERPEERVFVLTLTALPEVIVLLGFVMAILING
jgi:V/A-type H+/Na+-transporting ATPase subunit K